MSQTIETVRAGFIPLVDAAPLIVASELGFANEEDLNLQLIRETSWATIRDRLAVAHLDIAHILAPLPVAANLGLTPLGVPMVVPMALGNGANTITISRKVYENELAVHNPPQDLSAHGTLEAFSAMVAARRKQKLEPIKLGIVHAFSAHNYQLSYWLAAANIDLTEDVELVVVPPSLMPAALAAGQIDGFCAGEPWGTAAVLEGSGFILTTNAHIWRNSPEKVISARQSWVSEDQERIAKLIRAIYRAAVWCDQGDNQEALTLLLARPEYLGVPVDHIRPSLKRRLLAQDGSPHSVEGFLNFSQNAATFPWASHALWFYSQMIRWGQAELHERALTAARATYRPGLYRKALASLSVELPRADSKVEGAMPRAMPVGSRKGDLVLGPDTFFDGATFDPDDLDGYLRKLP